VLLEGPAGIMSHRTFASQPLSARADLAPQV
jgi:hypothetical protein